jgi:hypothetical protein
MRRDLQRCLLLHAILRLLTTHHGQHPTLKALPLRPSLSSFNERNLLSYSRAIRAATLFMNLTKVGNYVLKH